MDRRKHRALKLRWFASAALGLVMLAIAISPAWAADQPLAKIPLSFGGNPLFGALDNDGRQGPRGSWTIGAGGLVDSGTLRLDVVLEPLAHGLPVESGPAALFAGLTVVGDPGGDMGFDVAVDDLSMVALDPCDDQACRYDATIDLSTRRLGLALEQVEQVGDVIGVDVNLTLVRTFGGGAWLQVTTLDRPDGGSIPGSAGVLGATLETRGSLFPYGLFPASKANPVEQSRSQPWAPLDYAAVVDEVRRTLGDDTIGIPTVESRLRVTMGPACEHASHLAMHDDTGDHIFDLDMYHVAAIDEVVEMPTGVTWHLTLHDGGGIDFDQRSGWGIRAGDIRSDGDPVDIEATFDCGVPSGIVAVTGGVLEPTPSPTPASVVSASPAVTATLVARASEAVTSEPTQSSVSGESSPTGYGRLAAIALVAVAIFAAGITIATTVRQRRRRS